jgi:site-specific DNA-cytosine methylase
MNLNVLSLFAGVGGIELGLEAVGMTTVGQVEWDDYCKKVLGRHWPEVDRHDDVSTAVSDLHTLGFDAEWATLRASDFGAPHGRERVYILAYPSGEHGISRSGLVESGKRGPSLTTGGLSGLAVHQRRERARQWLASEP